MIPKIEMTGWDRKEPGNESLREGSHGLGFHFDGANQRQVLFSKVDLPRGFGFDIKEGRRILGVDTYYEQEARRLKIR
jgi:hypothetical protein